MMRTRNHLKTDAETKGESDEDNQPGESGEKPAADTDSILCVVRWNTKWMNMCCVLCVRLGVFQPGTKQKSIALHCFVSKWLLANIPLSRVSFEWKETLNQSVKCFLKAETTLEYHLAEPISLSKHISQLIFLAKFWLHFYLSYFNKSNNQICMIKK